MALTKRAPKKVFKKRYLTIRSKHPSIDPLRKTILLPKKVVYRHGSVTELDPEKYVAEINTTEAIRNSGSKRRMKVRFSANGVPTPEWFAAGQGGLLPITGTIENGQVVERTGELITFENLTYPILAKKVFGSQGKGMYKLDNAEQLQTFMEQNIYPVRGHGYYFEKYYNYTREYRLHVTKDGCFYTCRKMIKEDTPEDKRWFRNDSNSVWILEENQLFDKPVNWKEIEDACVKALLAVGLDIGAVDLRVQSTSTTKGKKRERSEFMVIEINSAPSMGEITLIKYKEKLLQIGNEKLNGRTT